MIYAETIGDADYVDDGSHRASAPAQAKCLLHSLEQVARGVSLGVNSDKTDFMCFKHGVMFTLNDKPLKLVDYFTYFGSKILSTETYAYRKMCQYYYITAPLRL